MRIARNAVNKELFPGKLNHAKLYPAIVRRVFCPTVRVAANKTKFQIRCQEGRSLITRSLASMAGGAGIGWGDTVNASLNSLRNCAAP